MSFRHNFLNFWIQEGASLPGLDSAHLRASDCVWLFPSHLSHVALLSTGNSRPEADSAAAGSRVSGLLGVTLPGPTQWLSTWGWVSVPTADGTLPLSKAVCFESGIPCFHWLWGGWGTLAGGACGNPKGRWWCLYVPADFQGYTAVQGWIPPSFFGLFLFLFFPFCKTFGFEEKKKTHFKGLFENLEYPNFSDNIFCYF